MTSGRSIRLLLTLALLAGLLVWVGHQHDDHTLDGACVICKVAVGWTATVVAGVIVVTRLSERSAPIPDQVLGTPQWYALPCGPRAPPASRN